MAAHPQDVAYNASIADPSKFWSHQAEQLTWHSKPTTAFSKKTRKLKSGDSYP
ncbi:hypothetical protein KC352_g41267, partial [Hortaea werneckii]